MTAERGMVLNLQRFTVHDGPGIRTLVFMKGCPLRCSWCSNPESQQSAPELRYLKSRCVGCGKCVAACSGGAIGVTGTDGITFDRDACTACGECAAVCLYDAREIAGGWYTIEELLHEVEKDREFYANSGGGVTVGGGEPTGQHRFVRDFLRLCRERWLHTALETCGYAPWGNLEEILDQVDFLFYDLKHIDTAVHQRITGAPNDLVLGNLERIMARKTRPEVVVRIPVIPGLNDSEANIAATSAWVSRLGGVKGIELLPYHRLGVSKYEELGRQYPLETAITHDVEHMKELQGIVAAFGLALD